MSGLSWGGFNIFGERKSVEEVRRLIQVEGAYNSMRDEVMRLQIRLQAAEQRISDMSWTPGSYQNGA
jgi:hypothetical protein